LPEAIFELRYLTANNVLGRPLHDDSRALVDERLIDPLTKVTAHLLASSLRPKFWDLGRTVEVQQQLLEATTDSRYVLSPDESGHVQHTSIDMTLAYLDGVELDMGTDFDDFTERAHLDTQEVTDAQRNNRVKLATFMGRVGFTQLPTEWWHFDFVGVPVTPTAVLK
jgi:D-alanyl-D-alanine dipeptidase